MQINLYSNFYALVKTIEVLKWLEKSGTEALRRTKSYDSTKRDVPRFSHGFSLTIIAESSRHTIKTCLTLERKYSIANGNVFVPQQDRFPRKEHLPASTVDENMRTRVDDYENIY